MRLVQLETRRGARAVAVVEQRSLRLLDGPASVRELALHAIELRASEAGLGLERLVERLASSELEDYDRALQEQRLFPPLDHPDPAHVLVSGTGLTHLGSARTRAGMHVAEAKPAAQTDSMRLFELGVEHGKPRDGSVGAQPEWFYKGDGSCLTRPGHALRVPDFSLDAGEEPEVVGLYVVSPGGEPHRIGFALGNELSDHVLERQNYLYLAHSKLRPCAIGPELLLGELPRELAGQTRIWRSGQLLWQGEFHSGEGNMSHYLHGLEHHHFKYPMFRSPGSVHVHFFGTATLSFAAGVRTQPGDVFEIECSDFGAPLRNTLERAEAPAPVVRVL